MSTEKQTEKKKKTGGGQQAAVMIVFVLIGAVCGIMMTEYMDKMYEAGASGTDVLLQGVILFAAMYIAIFVQIVLHEGGHLIFGLLTGYRFCSFRVGSLMWKMEDGKLKFCRFSLAGTGGQCLMAPPEMVDGSYPFALYNLGGVLVNLISAAICGLCYPLCKEIPFVGVVLLMLAIIGVAFALVNGIPMGANGSNDGSNLISIGKNTEALHAFWLQMKISELASAGMRLKDMPEEWFVMPSEEAMKNSMVAGIGVFCCNRKMDQLEIAEADQMMEKLLDLDTGMVEIHRRILMLERIYCELVGECRKKIVNNWLDKQQKQFIKAMKTNPSILRIEYACAVLLDNDRGKAEKIKTAFEKAAKSYPNPADIEGERELMAYVDKVSAEKTA